MENVTVAKSKNTFLIMKATFSFIVPRKKINNSTAKNAEAFINHVRLKMLANRLKKCILN